MMPLIESMDKDGSQWDEGGWIREQGIRMEAEKISDAGI